MEIKSKENESQKSLTLQNLDLQLIQSQYILKIGFKIRQAVLLADNFVWVLGDSGKF